MTGRIRLSTIGAIIAYSALMSACGGSDNNNDSEALKFQAGEYAGEVEVAVEESGTLCEFYAGSYPIDWNYVPTADNSYEVYDGDYRIASASLSSDEQQAVVEFADVENYVYSDEVYCRGTETVTATSQSESTVYWRYQGEATCDNGVTCHYSGGGLLNLQ
ncbi:MAG: hypothetical protein PHC51_12155 [bacterium]|nr:hypothetical protein [bacterium]